MNVNDPEFYQASKFEPAHIDAPRGRGCFFYGCVFAGVGMLIMISLCGVGGFFMYKSLQNVVVEYTGTEPRPLPKVEVTKEEQAELRERVAAFRKALEAGDDTPPLELSSDDVNALIEQNGDFKDKIYVKLDGDKIKGQVSLPLDEIGENIPIFGRLVIGRYLNGEAEFKASIKDGEPIVRIESIEANGKTLPEELMKSLRTENLAKDARRNPENAEMFDKIESLEVKDGKLIIKARSKEKPSAPPENGAIPKPSAEAKPSSTEPPKEPKKETAPDTPTTKPAPDTPAEKKAA